MRHHTHLPLYEVIRCSPLRDVRSVASVQREYRSSAFLALVAVFNYRRRAGVIGFTVGEQLLHLQKQFSSRSKEVVENW